MERIIGSIKSIHSEKIYFVKYNSTYGTVWISENNRFWLNVCEGVKTEEDGLSCASHYINTQKKIF